MTLNQKTQHRLLLIFLGIVTTGLSSLFLFFSPNRSTQDFGGLDRLAEATLTNDLSVFQEKKSDLRKKVRAALKHSPSSQDYQAATNIAAYLFPSELPQGDFEGETASTQWLPLQQGIEAAPHTAESREKFDELQAEVWNYENPNRQNPELTETATTMLHIYDVMSKP